MNTESSELRFAVKVYSRVLRQSIWVVLNYPCDQRSEQKVYHGEEGVRTYKDTAVNEPGMATCVHAARWKPALRCTCCSAMLHAGMKRLGCLVNSREGV
jgi:hypothetical protein